MPNVLMPVTRDNTLLNKITNREPLTDEDFAAMDSFERKVYMEINLSEEEQEARARRAALKNTPGRPLPPGVTLDDLFKEANLFGDISDEELQRQIETIGK